MRPGRTFAMVVVAATTLSTVAFSASSVSAAQDQGLRGLDVAAPTARKGPAMAVDAKGQLILFGGISSHWCFGDTWTWDGTTWTQLHPSSFPLPRANMGMAYDAATGQVTMFGGACGPSILSETWTWDGDTWTPQDPATSPPATEEMGMAYDPLRNQVVLFGGYPVNGNTWTWDGTTWTQQHPKHSPTARWGVGMTYDDLEGEVVLFGGSDGTNDRSDTWAWDGTDWHQMHPASSPPGREGPAMAYDAAAGVVTLAGGRCDTQCPRPYDTWTWDGTNWSEQFPAANPQSRYYPSAAYDSTKGDIVMFGGERRSAFLNDTWVWDGANWVSGVISIFPKSGRRGTIVQVNGSGFLPDEIVGLGFNHTWAGSIRADATGTFTKTIVIPYWAYDGENDVHLLGKMSSRYAEASFLVP